MVWIHIVAPTLAAVLLLIRESVERGRRTLLILVIGLLVIDVVAAVVTEYEQRRDEHCKQSSGSLQSESLSPDFMPRFRTGGQLGAYIQSPAAGGGSIGINLGSDRATAKIKAGRPVVSFVFRNADGNVVAEVIENEWRVAANQTLEHNYDANGLEILGPRGDILVQVDLRDGDVRLAGQFHGREGGEFRMGPFLGDGFAGRMFNYPSCLHPGERPQPLRSEP